MLLKWIPQEKRAPLIAEDAIEMFESSETHSDNLVLDEKALDDVKTLMQERFVFFLELYLNDAESQISIINKGISQTVSSHEVVIAAHTLKSSSSQMGAVQVSALASKIEHAVKAGNENTEALQSTIDELQQAFDAVKPLFEKEIAQQKAA